MTAHDRASGSANRTRAQVRLYGLSNLCRRNCRHTHPDNHRRRRMELRSGPRSKSQRTPVPRCIVHSSRTRPSFRCAPPTRVRPHQHQERRPSRCVWHTPDHTLPRCTGRQVRQVRHASRSTPARPPGAANRCAYLLAPATGASSSFGSGDGCGQPLVSDAHGPPVPRPIQHRA